MIKVSNIGTNDRRFLTTDCLRQQTDYSNTKEIAVRFDIDKKSKKKLKHIFAKYERLVLNFMQ